MMKTAMVFIALSLLADVVFGALSVNMKKQQPPMYYNIVEAALSNNLSIFIDLLHTSDLVHTFSNHDLVATAFVPTDAAFTNILEEQDLTLEELSSDNATLSSILLYHVVPDQQLFSTDLMDDMDLVTMDSGILTMNITDDMVFISGDDSDASVIKTDLTAGQGIVHVIDNVLLPFMF